MGHQPSGRSDSTRASVAGLSPDDVPDDVPDGFLVG
jgi:hypothetical protein